jgi:hypothetical protein
MMATHKATGCADSALSGLHGGKATSSMKRLKAVAGYASVVVLFAGLLTLEVRFIAMVVVAVVGVVLLVRQPTSPGDLSMTFLRAVMVAMFGATAGLSTVLAGYLPYGLVTAWISAARRSTGQD